MPTPGYTREIPQRYRLEANKCKNCGKISFPPRLVCPYCGARNFEPTKLSDTGKIVTFTTIRVAPGRYAAYVPYSIAIIELNDGVKITTQVVDCKPEDLEIGKAVRIIFRKMYPEGKTGIICYGYKAVLI